MSTIYITYRSEKCELGDSRFFGSPDLPDPFDWPMDAEGYDMEFLCQINCAQLPVSDGSVLPKKGMLYFFGNIAGALGEPTAPELPEGAQSPTDFSVRYTDADTETLCCGEIVDESGEPVGYSELKIDFTDDRNLCTEALHMIGGEAPDGSDDVVLLRADSFSGDDFDLAFPNDGSLYFLIDKNDLEAGAFDRVRCFIAE